MRWPALITILALSTPAFAEDDMRAHFERGAALYKATRYEAALHEFEAAQAVHPLPALQYDIAKCLDQLGRRKEAIAAYGRFLETSPESENANDVRKRVAELHAADVTTASAASSSPATAVHVTPPVPLSPPPRRQYLVPGLAGGAALALGAVGAGLLGATAHDYRGLETSCSPTCSRGSWATLPAREHAGEAMLGLAGVAVVVDVALWVRAKRRK